MRRSTFRVTLVILAIGALTFGTAMQASGAPKSQGCNQTPNGTSGHGANKSGPYDDTCVPTASLNGNGNGKAVGKPCAGCVGKADEKNPPGQQPGGSDHNNGYECDGNNGVGKTNPAHTGCVNPPPQCTQDCGPPGCKKNCDPPPPRCTSNCGDNPPEVLGKRVVRAEVAGEVLARTGVSIRVLLGIAGAFLILGWSLKRIGADQLRPVPIDKR